MSAGVPRLSNSMPSMARAKRASAQLYGAQLQAAATRQSGANECASATCDAPPASWTRSSTIAQFAPVDELKSELTTPGGTGTGTGKGKGNTSVRGFLTPSTSACSKRRFGYNTLIRSFDTLNFRRTSKSRSMEDSSEGQELASLIGRPPRPATLGLRPTAHALPEIAVVQASPSSECAASGFDCPSASTVTPDPDSGLLSSGERQRAFNRRSLREKLNDTSAFINRMTRKLSQPIMTRAAYSGDLAAPELPRPEDPSNIYAATPGESRPVLWKQQIKALFQPSDNKLAMKLFGTKSALLKEKSRQCETGHLIVHPCSPFRYYWDFVMLIMLITTMLASPVAIAFFNDVDEVGWVIYNCFCDSCFLMDIIVNFRTGIILNDVADEVILDPHRIAVHYVKSWFVLDLISSIPLDYFFLLVDVNSQTANMGQLVHAGRALRILRLAKLLSLLRLLRVSRLVRYVNEWEEFLNIAAVVMRVLNLTFLILLLGHWDACLQFLVPMLRDFPPDSWPALEELVGKSWIEQYTWSLFRALSHMLCIGYGRFPPQNQTDTWLTMTSMMCGAICYAMFVGHVTALIQSFDTAKRLYREKFKQVEEYMSYRKLPRLLRQKICDYYEHRYQGRMFDENSIMLELSDCLRGEIANHNCRTLVAAVPFLKHADPNFVLAIVPSLRFEVFQPGDIIIKADTFGDKMYFIQEGIIDVINKKNEVVTSLSDGSYFGEICLLANCPRSATIRAVTYCYIYSLMREHFLSVLDEYPIMRRTIEGIAAERLLHIGLDPSILGRRPDVNEDLEAVKQLMERVIALENENETESDDHITQSDNVLSCKKRKRKKHNRQTTAPLTLFKSRSQNSFAEILRNRKVKKNFSLPRNKNYSRRNTRCNVDYTVANGESDEEPTCEKGEHSKKRIESTSALETGRNEGERFYRRRETLNCVSLSHCLSASPAVKPLSHVKARPDYSASCKDVSISFEPAL